MPAYKIEIDAVPGLVTFAPAELTVNAGDQISWTNNTDSPQSPGVVNQDKSFVGFFDCPIEAGGVSDVFSPTPQVDSSGNQLNYTMTYTLEKSRTVIGTLHVNATP